MFDLTTTSRNKSCLTCDLYLKCKDVHKSATYSCKHHTKTSLKELSKKFELSSSTLVSKQKPQETNSIEISGDFNIAELIDSVIKTDSMVSPDIKINDRDFPLAPNFYTFCTSDKYQNSKPFLEQALIGTIVFSEYCPRCSDMEWILETHKVNDKLSKFEKKVALLEHGICPYCRATKSDLVTAEDLNFYYEADIAAGQRSGKSALVSDKSAYLTHRMLKLQNPNKVYDLKASNMLHGTFVALTFNQAKDNLWDPYYGNILEGNWFKDYHAMLDEYQSKHGEELYKLKDTFLLYKHRRIIIYPAGPDKRILRGRTRFLGAIDELGWFDNEAGSKKIKTNAHEVYVALQNSLVTVRGEADRLLKMGFNNIPTGYFFNISSPSSSRDKIMELVRHAQGSRHIFGLIKPTWEMNPRLPFNSPVIQEEFKKDPVVAMRDLGAQPPLASNPFIGSSDTVERCIGKRSNPIKIQYRQTKSKDGTTKRYAYVENIKSSGKPSVLAIDAGYSNNSFACCVAHLKDDAIPVIDLLVEVMPLPGIKLNYHKIYKELIGPIIDERNVVFMAADRWNSIKILSDTEAEYGIVTKQYSVKYQDFHVFKDYMESQQLIIPKPSVPIEDVLKYDHSQYPTCFKTKPIDHFLLQCLTVQDTGNSVIKGDQLTDDLFRASVLAVSILLDQANREYFNQPEKQLTGKIDVTKMAVMRGASNGAKSSGGSMSSQSNLGMVKRANW